MSGASGATLGVRALQALKAAPAIETHLVISVAARRTLMEQTDWTAGEVETLADVVHDLFGIEHTLLKRWKDGEAPLAGQASEPVAVMQFSRSSGFVL
jgi:3-polyprenyl-4-hydroxybenzoate decarboxylase